MVRNDPHRLLDPIGASSEVDPPIMTRFVLPVHYQIDHAGPKVVYLESYGPHIDDVGPIAVYLERYGPNIKAFSYPAVA